VYLVESPTPCFARADAYGLSPSLVSECEPEPEQEREHEEESDEH
jgi:hypothetical protein